MAEWVLEEIERKGIGESENGQVMLHIEHKITDN